MDCRAQESSVHSVSLTDSVDVCGVCAQARSAPLFTGGVSIHAGLDGKANAGDFAACAALVRLLAA